MIPSPATLHGSHCFSPEGVAWCGWPDFHRCCEPDCKRTVRPDWALCEDHGQKVIDRALGVTAPVGDLPRWAAAG